MDNRLSVGGICCDLEKAFDCVNHEILVGKLQFYGIWRKFLALIQLYLRGRYQKVLIDKFNAYDDASSGLRKITTGVPQGSILLFLIYINDLFMVTNSNTKVVLLSDDTIIIITSPNQERLQTALNKTLSDINLWFKGNFLSLNFNKTYYLQFQTKNYIDNTLDINYLNKNIANHSYTKFLGLMVDDNLTWNNHTDQLISKLNSACYAIGAVNAMLSGKGLRMLCFSYVRSIIYGIIFGGNSIKIFRIQKKSFKNYE
jgi:hypothetical protein